MQKFCIHLHSEINTCKTNWVKGPPKINDPETEEEISHALVHFLSWLKFPTKKETFRHASVQNCLLLLRLLSSMSQVTKLLHLLILV